MGYRKKWTLCFLKKKKKVFFIDLKVQAIYSGFKHVVQVRTTDFCIENLVSLRACLVTVL